VAGSALGALFWAHETERTRRERLERIELAWETSQKERRDRRFDAALAALDQARRLAQEGGDAESWADKVTLELQATRNAKLLEELHHVAQDIRFAAGALYRSPRHDELAGACRSIWDARRKVLALAQEPDADSRQARTDLLDIALIGVHLDASQPAPSHGAALDRLAEAEALFGPSPVLFRERLRHARALADLATAEAAQGAFEKMPPRSAWEHYTLGRSLLQEGDCEAAAKYLERAVALDPAAFWPNFHEGLCAYRRGKDDQAISAFRAAIVAEPRLAAPYFNRGLAYARRKDEKKARADFDRALELQPELAPLIQKVTREAF
jgi:tetratricopeptide (TPR) repeat protein